MNSVFISTSECRVCQLPYPTHYKKCPACRKIRADLLSKFIQDIKTQPCSDCGESFHFASMQFDHCRGEKLFNLADAVGLEKSYDTVLDEIKKCDVVCANCHALKTYAERHELDVVSFFAENGLEHRRMKKNKLRVYNRLWRWVQEKLYLY